MRLLRRLGAVILLLITVGLFIAASWIFAFQTAFFNAETFTSALDNDQFYVDLAPVALLTIFDEQNIRTQFVDFGDIAETIGEDRWQEVTNELIPPAWLRQQIESAISVFFAVVDGDVDAVNQPLAVGEIQTRLLGLPAERAVDMILDNAPACTVQQNTMVRAINNGRQTTLPICNPRGDLRDVSRSVLLQTLRQIADIVGTTDLEFRNFLDNADTENLLTVSLGFDVINRMINILYLCPLALLSVVVVLVVRSLKGFGRWLGWTTLISGILIVLPLVFVSVALLDSVSELLNVTTPLEELLQQVLLGVVEATFSRLSSSVLLQGGVVAAFGVILLIISAVAPDSQPYIPPGSVVTTPDGQVISTVGSTPANRKEK